MRTSKRYGRSAALLILLTLVVPVSPVSARPPDPETRIGPGSVAAKAAGSLPDPGGTRRPAAVVRLATTPTVGLEPCAEDPAWLCGSLDVPLDRGGSDGRTIAIGFEVLAHRDPASTARDALVVTAGGPGIATTPDRGFWQFLLDPLLDERDLLLIDDRGTGTSAPIDCPALQAGVFEHDAAIKAAGECGAQLGKDADRYGSGDVAMDVEAVRRALDYPQLSYLGPSYGSVDVQAYAVRYPHRVRAIVLDAGLPVNDRRHAWTWGLDEPHAIARNTALACLRAPACADAQPDARAAVADLARMLRKHPVDGTARDLNGTLRNVHVDEVTLINIATADILNPGQLAAASDALEAGDEQPLVRLAAELFFEGGEPDDPAFFSAGDNAAVFCNDADFVWQRGDPIGVRRAKYARALDDLGRHRFAPFSKQAWATYWIPDFCLLWPAPDRFTPAVPRGAKVMGVPTLLIGGERDINVPSETTRSLVRVFPEATFVNFAGALHLPLSWSECARTVAQHFFATLDPGDTSCASEPAFIPAATPQFPLTARHATPATALPGNAATVADRRVVTVSVRAVLDAFTRSFKIPGATGTGYGLRGGTFDFEFGPDEAVLQLHGIRFSRDVTVDGHATLVYDGQGVTMELTVHGPRGRVGTLAAEGAFGPGEPFEAFSVTGVLGGRTVSASVPAN